MCRSKSSRHLWKTKNKIYLRRRPYLFDLLRGRLPCQWSMEDIVRGIAGFILITGFICVLAINVCENVKEYKKKQEEKNNIK